MAIVSLGANDSGSTSRTVINDNFTDLDTTKADLASPALTGNPTAPTQTAGDNSTKIATTAYADNAASTIIMETTTGTTHSLTTTAGQVVAVWAKGQLVASGGGIAGAVLSYNSVQKDIVQGQIDADNDPTPFALMYTEVPGAGTHNITVTVSGSASLSNVVIMVQKIS